LAIINHGTREISLKIVYWGTGFSGKTENVVWLSRRILGEDPLVLATQEGRTLFFDFKPLSKELPNGYRVRYSVYTVPGQAIYAASRRLVVEGADGIVFVVDSQRERFENNLMALEELLSVVGPENLGSRIPLVIQYNKRDLENIYPVEFLREKLNRFRAPDFEAVALKGIGVEETFNAIAELSLERVLQNAKLQGEEANLNR